jgi:hypothetical protein
VQLHYRRKIYENISYAIIVPIATIYLKAKKGLKHMMICSKARLGSDLALVAN